MSDNFTPGSKRLLGFSPVKAAPLPALNIGMSTRETSVIPEQPEEAEEDTETMLAKMKQMVEGVKRRQSMGPRPSLVLSPRKPGEFSLLASTPGASPAPGSVRRVSDPDKNPFAEDSGEVDIEMEAEEQDHSIVEPPRPSASFATPQLTGVRELFRNPGRAMPTPRMDGMKELFRVERPPQTPAFEGVGEMLTTPAAYRAPTQNVEAQVEFADVGATKEPTRNSVASRLRQPVALGSRIPATRRAAASRSAPARVPSNRASEEQAPAEPSGSKLLPAAARVIRKPRSKGLEIEKVR